jgi:hypothetical protein
VAVGLVIVSLATVTLLRRTSSPRNAIGTPGAVRTAGDTSGTAMARLPVPTTVTSTSQPAVPTATTTTVQPGMPTSGGQTPQGTSQGTSGPSGTRLSLREQHAFQESSLATKRDKLLEAMQKELGPGLILSVDRLGFTTEPPTIVASVSSSIAGVSVPDAAWTITRSMLVLWEPATMVRVPNSVPGFRLLLNTARIECPPGLMLQLGYGTASREQWVSECSGLL